MGIHDVCEVWYRKLVGRYCVLPLEFVYAESRVPSVASQCQAKYNGFAYRCMRKYYTFSHLHRNEETR